MRCSDRRGRQFLQEKYRVIDSDMIRTGGKDWDVKIEEYIIRELKISMQSQSEITLAIVRKLKERQSCQTCVQ